MKSKKWFPFACGAAGAAMLATVFSPAENAQEIAAMIIAAVSGFLCAYIFVRYVMQNVDARQGEVTIQPGSRSLGLIVGLFTAFLITAPLRGVGFPPLSWCAQALCYILLGYAGAIPLHNILPQLQLFDVTRANESAKGGEAAGSMPKILDTSVIVDGRIFDICATGFVEGPLVVPQFVLQELRHIADSSDTLKRNRGRRGLSVLTRIQKELEIPVEIDETDFEDTDEVDVKLLKLAKKLTGRVVTNDYNLNKVAGVTGVPVLNINELANAIKPVLLPGEELTIQVVREGKEAGQGVAFLDDGTMIVVENGRKFIGETVNITVSTVLQTVAGRMIFAKITQ